MENLQQQLRSIEAEHQARMAAWNQHSANNVHQQNMGGDSGGRKSRWDKTAPVGKLSGNGGRGVYSTWDPLLRGGGKK